MIEENLKALIDKVISDPELDDEEHIALLDPYLNGLVSIAKKDHLSESPNKSNRRKLMNRELDDLLKAIN